MSESGLTLCDAGVMTSPGDAGFAPLVGRGAELQVVDTAVRRLSEHQGGAIAVVGPAGVGKSRLARETATIAEHAGATVLSGRAVATGASTAYRPLVEALAPWARLHPANELDLGPHQRGIEALLPGAGASGGGGGLSDAISPVFVAEALVRALPHLGRGGAVVLTLEDLHWADDETLAAVEYLADAAESLPLLLVVTARDDEGAAARRLIRALSARGSMRLVRVSPFEVAAVRDLAELRLGQQVSQRLLELLVERSDGLPLFVEELLAALDLSGRLVRGDVVDIAPDAHRVLPMTVADTVAARLDVMSEDERRVVETAALLGRSFAHAPVAAINDSSAVSAALQQAVSLGLMHEDPDRPGELRFRHALLRDGVIVSTFPPRRAELARELLGLLLADELSDDDLAIAVDLAARAGDNAQAARLALRRAMAAFEVWAMATAEHGLAEARGYAGTDPDLLIEIDVAQMRVASIMGRLPIVMQLAHALLTRLDRVGGRHDNELLETHLRMGQTLLEEESWQDALPHMETAASLMHTADPCQVTRLEMWWSLLDRLRGDVASARARAVRAAELARPHADQPDLVCCALLYEGRAWLRDDVETARARWAEGLAYADEYGLRLWRARMLVEPALLELDELVGDMDIDSVLAEADELARECGGLDTRTRIALFKARLGLLRADVDGCSAALAVAEQFGVAGAASRRMHADLASALSALRAREAADEPGRAAQIFSALMSDDIATARTLAQHPDVQVPGWRGPLGLFVDIAAGVERAVGTTGAGSAVAAAHALLPDLSAATARLAEAPLVAAVFTRVHATGAPDDRDALHSAVATFDRVGLTRPADACRAMLREAGVPLPRRSSAMDGVPEELRAVGVTARELEVLQLIAEGHTNRDVAAALYLSPRTVEKHVERLLMKTGAPNRTALAALMRANA